MALTVGELSRLSGVTVRTLHHYDEIGLVRPSERTAAGYRLYADADVLRLQQVLVFRELGMPLDEIAEALDQATDRAALLRTHRQALVARRGKLDAMLAAIDTALMALEKGPTIMSSEDFKNLFDGFDPATYEDEVNERWGATEAYQESARRTKGYGKPEWEQIKAESTAIYQQLSELMTAGAAPADPAVQAAIEAHRQHITRWFYPCTKEIHRGLAEMYVADPRFTASIETFGAGLAPFLRDAIAASP
jgi:DNA-binding transcriptional MerR regulator